MRILRSLMLPATILIVGGGCATGSHIDRRAGLKAAQTTAVFIEVENDNWADVIVYVVSSGYRTRIGRAESMHSSVLRLPLITDGYIRFQLRPLASEEYYTLDPVLVTPGQRISMSVRNALQLSTLMVLPR